MQALRIMSAAGLALAMSACATAPASPPPPAATLGAFDRQQDVGETAIAGAAAFGDGRYTVTGGGANIWGNVDAFHYVYTQRSGDLHIAADISFVGAGGEEHRKAGLMIRQNLTPGSPYVDVMVHGNGLTSLQYREVQDGPTHQISSNVSAPTRVRLEREGNYAFFSVAGADGQLRHAGGNFRIAFQEPYYVGLAVSAHNNALSETATFSNVEMNAPHLADVPDTGYPAAVESTLEILDMSGGDMGDRRIVRHFTGVKIEAPNWSRDGRTLIYNSGGHLWSISVDGGEPVMINTGDRVKLNNDHGLSPDGAQLMISDQTEADNISRIYTLPLTGSDHPRLVVSHRTARSYWHAWTPDGRTIAYTASRPETGTDDYDIYAKAANGRGRERNLTHSMGLDDGPEYTPDGQYIYFNSTRSGAMQIWRARARDGANPERITTDETYRDWFPHFSPDGQRMAFVSFFANDVRVDDHPPNRDVQIRVQPTDRSAPPIIVTKLFGGQGTMNVPSWSPDGQYLAFVSYRLVR
ncbi:MAG TPA: hypothetical protein VG841_06800 [Caulobacterales bacterium]|nr:hypothetical protein [Caulobacterales bacterium]